MVNDYSVHHQEYPPPPSPPLSCILPIHASVLTCALPVVDGTDTVGEVVPYPAHVGHMHGQSPRVLVEPRGEFLCVWGVLVGDFWEPRFVRVVMRVSAVSCEICHVCSGYGRCMLLVVVAPIGVSSSPHLALLKNATPFCTSATVISFHMFMHLSSMKNYRNANTIIRAQYSNINSVFSYSFGAWRIVFSAVLFGQKVIPCDRRPGVIGYAVGQSVECVLHVTNQKPNMSVSPGGILGVRSVRRPRNPGLSRTSDMCVYVILSAFDWP